MFLTHYTLLGQHAEAEGLLLWNFKPKSHYLWHLARQSQFLHPALAACYVDEDFVGIIKNIAQRSSDGSKLECIGQRVFDKYACGMQLTWCTSEHGGLLWNQLLIDPR